MNAAVRGPSAAGTWWSIALWGLIACSRGSAPASQAVGTAPSNDSAPRVLVDSLQIGQPDLDARSARHAVRQVGEADLEIHERTGLRLIHGRLLARTEALPGIGNWLRIGSVDQYECDLLLSSDAVPRIVSLVPGACLFELTGAAFGTGDGPAGLANLRIVNLRRFGPPVLAPEAVPQLAPLPPGPIDLEVQLVRRHMITLVPNSADTFTLAPKPPDEIGCAVRFSPWSPSVWVGETRCGREGKHRSDSQRQRDPEICYSFAQYRADCIRPIADAPMGCSADRGPAAVRYVPAVPYDEDRAAHRDNDAESLCPP